ncbi:2-amino-4-hydroxy-6-hydroxymethyldihydropteridine diphosphokinase [Phreatobacter sp. AB_2022a]|uniref:2-amino-4-hydroxy-6- hydroxymethyldihydropteridine diphosphokinase n=1 Tax=Phreatobacter sp. AB_2022a TaxID=3003134 RepID=UPI00228727E9|nr:2-amino-4-hydroxy-6-hydroxymethyldihydropteridine diphosphokinase [Phreatobacter sp. AB_2022a]MCZ0733768.1 2-amino-4-hydroxy-6-hydroxymethyldihydropteridine diphosphokinase [Phreatobacter sp. AB_2022a]
MTEPSGSDAAPVDALISLGGNIGDVRATLDRAVDLFCDGIAVRLKARSADYATPPWGVTDQPPFVNLALSVDTTLGPRGLLERALAVEARLGRERARSRRWGPRPVDIDIIAYGDVSLDEPDLHLPHPRLGERAFVLVPLAEIVPNRLIGGRRVGDLAREIDAAGIERLPARQAAERPARP